MVSAVCCPDLLQRTPRSGVEGHNLVSSPRPVLRLLASHGSLAARGSSARSRVSLSSELHGRQLSSPLSQRKRERCSGSGRGGGAAIVCGVPSITEADFETEVLKAEKPVLVDFWAQWCGPCKLVVPIIDWAAEEYDGKLKVIKVETDNGSKFVEQYKVYGLPSIMLFQNGEKVPGTHIEGAITKRRLKEMLDKQLAAIGA